MKLHFFHLVLSALAAILFSLTWIIKSNFSAKVETAERATLDAKETAEEVITLSEALRRVDAERIQTRRVVDFILDHSCVAVIEADAGGWILSARGDVEALRWTRDGLVGKNVADMLPEADRAAHLAAFEARIKEGRTGGVYAFLAEPSLSEAGELLYLNGVVLWHHERRRTVAFLSPSY
tara:strand:+ start:20355 stop:20894 length:540 start_codon:yes stop_codon:yes gene_type:complete